MTQLTTNFNSNKISPNLVQSTTNCRLSSIILYPDAFQIKRSNSKSFPIKWNFWIFFVQNNSFRSQWMVTPLFPLSATHPQSQKTTRVWNVDQKTQISPGLSSRTSSPWRFHVSLANKQSTVLFLSLFSLFFMGTLWL